MNSSASQTTSAVSIRIQGMSCDHCVKAVSEALARIDGLRVRSVSVGRAIVESENSGTLGRAIAAIEDAGYEAAPEAATPAPQSSSTCCGGPKPSGSGCCGAE